MKPGNDLGRAGFACLRGVWYHISFPRQVH